MRPSSLERNQSADQRVDDLYEPVGGSTEEAELLERHVARNELAHGVTYKVNLMLENCSYQRSRVQNAW